MSSVCHVWSKAESVNLCSAVVAKTLTQCGWPAGLMRPGVSVKKHGFLYCSHSTQWLKRS